MSAMTTQDAPASMRAGTGRGPRPLVLVWLAAILIAAGATLLAPQLPALAESPAWLELPLAGWLDAALAGIVAATKPAVRALAWTLTQPMLGLQALLNGLPWLTVAAALTLLSWIAAGWRLALTCAVGCLGTVALGYWTEALNTLALVGVSVPLAVLAGFGLGLLAHRYARLRHGIELCLDVMQTIPAFAYLIPILLLFGFGPVVGLIASAIYAAPPMVRNTLLGLRHVPEPQIESGTMSGCTPRQLFWQVRLPGAMPQILVGVNQTTMQSLSMVIIAAIIGGFDDIGWAILTALRKAQFGELGTRATISPLPLPVGPRHLLGDLRDPIADLVQRGAVARHLCCHLRVRNEHPACRLNEPPQPLGTALDPGRGQHFIERLKLRSRHLHADC